VANVKSGRNLRDFRSSPVLGHPKDATEDTVRDIRERETASLTHGVYGRSAGKEFRRVDAGI
jgi:hypothetical protein